VNAQCFQAIQEEAKPIMSHPDVNYPLAKAHIDDMLRAAAHARLVAEARRASPGFVPASRWRDTAFWVSIVGPLVAIGFLAYFVQEIVRGVTS
jgi:hypothetical protein